MKVLSVLSKGYGFNLVFDGRVDLIQLKSDIEALLQAIDEGTSTTPYILSYYDINKINNESIKKEQNKLKKIFKK